MKGILIASLIILLLASCLITSSACAPAAKFELTNLTISPAQALEGNSVLVSVDVTNSGEVKGPFDARLKIDEALFQMKFVPIAAGQTVTVSFIVDAPAAGSHDVELNGLAGTFSVLTHPVLAGLVISPAQAQVGDRVTISADISNAGEVPGNYTVVLKVNGLVEERKIVELGLDTTLPVVFDVIKDNPGNYSVSLGGLSGNFTMLKRAEFTMSNLIILPPQALPGWEVSIMCNVANTGEVDGFYPVSLKIDGVQVDSQDVLVPAGATQTVTFSLARETCGTYNVAVGGLSGTLAISEGLLPTLYVGDNWVFTEIYKGITYTRTETIMGEEGMEGKDCYVKKITYDPPLDGWILEETQWLEKATLNPVVSLISTTLGAAGLKMTRIVIYSREGTGTEWPYEVGNEFTVKTSWERTDFVSGQPFVATGDSTITYKCTNVEEVVVEAGTFRCFKIIAYENGQPTTEYWHSYQAKTFVKTRGVTDAHTTELLSYSVR
jgi:hypothetical protein